MKNNECIYYSLNILITHKFLNLALLKFDSVVEDLNSLILIKKLKHIKL